MIGSANGAMGRDGFRMSDLEPRLDVIEPLIELIASGLFATDAGR